MKKTHIIILVLAVFGIVGMSFFVKDITTQETFLSAGKKGGFVRVKAQLDKTKPVEYDAVKDPNTTVFYAHDLEGNPTRVVYKNAKPQDMERSEGLELNGYMKGDHFECTKMQMKCPSKYKDDMKAAEKNISASTQGQY